MKNICSLLIVSFISIAGIAQKKTTMPDIDAMMKMNPQELEAYQQRLLNQKSSEAKTIAAQYKLNINEIDLPDFELTLPKKNIKRLSLLPIKAPTLIELNAALNQSKKQIEALTPLAILEDLKQITGSQTPSQQQSSSIATFYNGNPIGGLLISINSVMQNASDATAWNNLAALFNMSGLEHKAIPILMHQLEKDPKNSMLLNNMGQAYLGLGDVSKATLYLQQCLSQDPLNPEANHSMGVIKFVTNQINEGMSYFEKELEITYRRSTLGLLSRKNKVANIYKLRKKRGEIPHTNFFDEIQLSKFKVPEFPKTTNDSRRASEIFSNFSMSVTSEMLFWLEKGNTSKEISTAEGKQYAGIYANMVETLLHDLHEVYTPYELSLMNDVQQNQIKAMIDSYHEKLSALKCPEGKANETIYETIAREKLCCEKQKEITDKFMSQYNEFVTMRVYAVVPVWKEYLNDFINIASLDPSSANRRLVCHELYQYFTFLASIPLNGQFIEKTCNNEMTLQEAEQILISERDFDFHCPKGLNISLDFSVVKIKGDCTKFGIEGGKFYQGSLEHSFKTGSSTIAVGVGVKADFTGKVAGAGIKQMIYLTLDENMHFEDIGLKGGAGVSVGGNMVGIAGGEAELGGVVAGIDAGYSLGINSGFHSSVKGKGFIAAILNIE